MRLTITRHYVAFWLLFSFITLQGFAQPVAPDSLSASPRDMPGHTHNDSDTGLIDTALEHDPYERLNEEGEKLLGTPEAGNSVTQNGLSGITWLERKSGDAGGRTKIDLAYHTNPPGKRVWSGSPLGGLRYTNDATDTYVFPYALSTVTITGISSQTLCSGGTFNVSFATSGSMPTNTNYEVWISDANGSFTNQKRLGSGTASPVSLTLPANLSYGTGYRLKIIAPEANTQSAESERLSVDNLTGIAIGDTRTPSWQTSSSASVCPGDRVRLNVSAGGFDSYQWSLNDVAISGATSQTYLTNQPGTYRVSVQQGVCSASSSAYQVYESNYISVGVISRFGSRPQCDDKPVMLYGSYKGELAAIQWKLNGNDLSGATSGTIVTAQSGAYSLAVSSSGCNVQSAPFALTLGRTLYASLQRNDQIDSVLCAGASMGTTRLTIGDINDFPIGIDGYSIDWYHNNKPLGRNQNQWSYIADQPGVYTYELRQGTCVTRSNPVAISVGTVVPPVIYLGESKNACPGDSRTMYLFSMYSAFQRCQWQKDGVDIAGAVGSSFTAQSSGNYTVRGIKGSCSATSQPVSLTFTNALIPIVSAQQEGGTGCVNVWLDANSYARQSGTQFQWYKDGAALSEQTNSNLNTMQPGLYSVRVTNGSCTGLSKGIYTRPYTAVKPIISTSTSSVCSNNSIRLFSLDLYSNIQWKRNGIAVTGGNSVNYYPVQSGLYSVYTSGCGGAESDPVDIRIGEPTMALISGNAVIEAGKRAQLPVTLTGPAPWSFTLSNGQTVQNTYLNPHPVSVTATANTTYSLVNVQNACGTGVAAGQATIRVGSGSADLSLASAVSNRVTRVGDIVSYSLILTNNGPMDSYNIRVTNRLPEGVEFVDTQSSGVGAANGVVTFDVGSLFLYNSVTLSYRLRINRSGTFANAAQVVAAYTPDPDSQPNSGTGDGEDDATVVYVRTMDATGSLVESPNPDQIPLPRVADSQPPMSQTAVELSLDLRSSHLSPSAGETINLSLTVGNRSGIKANNLVVQALLPAGWRATARPGVIVDGQTVRLYINQLAANGFVTVVLPAQVSSGSATVQAQVMDVIEPVANATPGNGYTNGERDEARIDVRVR